ncbi:MAG TPA: response regulator [Candidatus Limnocylindrales bacterium]|nr:response regulator [Candidatus Limnocylindrales bacterium]
MAQKILIIDDDLFIREIYTNVLKKAGYEVDLAENGEEGYSKLHSGGYSLCLLDMRMPDLSGLEVIERIQKNPPILPNGPLVLLTNMGFDQDAKEGMEKGANSYLVKADLTPDQLVENIKKLLLE